MPEARHLQTMKTILLSSDTSSKGADRSLMSDSTSKRPVNSVRAPYRNEESEQRTKYGGGIRGWTMRWREVFANNVQAV